MADIFDPVLLSRIQFAFTISFHIIFPAFTIGLASFLAVVEFMWLRSRGEIFLEIYRFWVKIFAVCFGLGVVSGIVMVYQFGTNWSAFSHYTGNVLGPLFAFEALTAFFLEASFLGIMIFGWGKVSERMHFASTAIVAIGTVISSFWILSANSWMQAPQAFELGLDNVLHPTDWIGVIFNPTFGWRLAHMLLAAYLSTAFAVGGVAAWYLFRGRHTPAARVMFSMFMLMAIFVTPVQVFVGHESGEDVAEYQPVKFAAMEGNWERASNVPFHIVGWPNEKTETTDYALSIPGAASWVLHFDTAGVVPGLKDVPATERPPVATVFWTFRIMVGIGLLMIVTGGAGLFLWLKGKLFETRWFHAWCILMAPTGFVALIAGWFVTEVGRQPWLVQGIMRTSEAVSPVAGDAVAASLLAFVVVYTILFGVGSWYILKLIRTGPVEPEGGWYSAGAERVWIMRLSGANRES